MIIAVSTSIRLFLAWHFDGFFTGDDVEILQEAFHWAFGMAYTPWDIRHLAIPHLLVAPVLQVARVAGVTCIDTLIAAAAIPFVMLSAVNIALTFAVARRWLDETTSLLAAFLYAMHWLPLFFGSMVYPRTVSTTLLLIAILALTGSRRTTATAIAAGLLVGLATLARYSEIIYMASLTTVVIATEGRRFRMLIGVTIGALVGLTLVGLYDLWTWGEAFASLRAFARYTLVERQSSSRVGQQPPWWYLLRLHEWIAPFLLPALIVGVRRAVPFLIPLVGLPLLILSAIHHKEVRYLQPIIPFLMIGVAAGTMVLLPRRRRVVLTLLLVGMAWQFVDVRLTAKRSAAAVAAARLVCTSRAKRVIVSQGWAYGGTLFFAKGVDVIDVGTPPDTERLALSLPAADIAMVYRGEATPALDELIRRQGLRYVRTISKDSSRRVSMYSRETLHTSSEEVCSCGIRSLSPERATSADIQ